MEDRVQVLNGILKSPTNKFGCLQLCLNLFIVNRAVKSSTLSDPLFKKYKQQQQQNFGSLHLGKRNETSGEVEVSFCGGG